MIDYIKTMFNTIMNVIDSLMTTLTSTINYIDGIQFSNNGITEFLGYVHWLLGDINYVALTTFFIAGIGVTLWSVSLKMIGYLKNLLPW